MDEQPDDGLGELAAESALAVTAGLALGSGPIGVIAAGAAPLAVRATGRLAAAISRRWEDKALRALRVAADILDVGVDILDERLPGHDARVELLARVIEAAARSTLEEKIPALGRVLAQGLSDGGDVDEALTLAAALAVLEAPHVLVLQLIADHPDGPPDWEPRRQGARSGWSAEELSRALPDQANVIDAVLPVLASQGLLKDSGGTNFFGQPLASQWTITQPASRCLFLLEFRDHGPVGEDD